VTAAAAGPLTGVRVLEIAGMGPVPHATHLMADFGADILRVDRPGAEKGPALPGRRSTAIDLRSPAGRDFFLSLVESADVVLEPFRPGVAERLGIGPQDVLARNPRVVYGRMTGWGQDGPLAQRAGHDINYLSLTGVLHAIGRPDDRPVVPLNLVGDFGGGSMLLLVGVLSALLEQARSGSGQVVDAAMVDGAGILSRNIWAARARGAWSDERGTNLLDGGAPFYDTYECADGRYVAVGALEPQFYESFVRGLGIDPTELPAQNDQASWPQLRQRFQDVLASRSRDEWTSVFEDVDACVTPVLTFAEAPDHAHAKAREAFTDVNGAILPTPAPRFSRSQRGTAAEAGAWLDADEAHRWWTGA
jgi:alpha-methylacyl-CoA racemase